MRGARVVTMLKIENLHAEIDGKQILIAAKDGPARWHNPHPTGERRMTEKKKGGEDSAWGGTNEGVNAHLVSATPPKRLEIGGAPVSEQSHEYVIRKRKPDAPN